MKLPKLPKLPSVAKLPKFSKLFRKKGDEDDDEDFADEFEDAGPPGKGPRPSFMHEDGGDPFADDEEDDFDDEEGAPLGRKPLIFMAAGGAVLLLGMLGGLGWWYFSQPSAPPPPPAPVAQSTTSDNGKRVSMALPPPPASTADNAGQSGGQAGDAAAPGGDTMAAAGGPAAKPLGGGLPQSALAPPSTGDLGPGQGVVVEAVARTAYNNVPDAPEAKRLRAEPFDFLQEKVKGIDKPLPKVAGSDTPMAKYARATDVGSDVRRIAIIMADVGLSRAAGIGVVTKLPPDVTIALSPYARSIDDWMVRARLAGHEVLVELPMDSERFPMTDAGPLALDSGIQSKQNILRLHQVMSRTSVYVGLLAVMGSKFDRADGQLRPVLTEIRDRGLMYVDGTRGRSAAPRIAAELKLPQAQVDRIIDNDPTPAAISAELTRLEAVAQQNGAAVGLAHPYPSTVQQIALWAATLPQKGYALVPVTAVADAQPVK